MAVKRIVANIAAPQPDAARAFYREVLGLEVVMDLGWIMTFAAAPVLMAPAIGIASEGGPASQSPIFPSRWTISMTCLPAPWRPVIP